MAPWYEKAEAKLGVTRTGDRPGLPGNNNYKVLEAGAKALGYKEVSTGRMAINAVDYDDRMPCQQTGFCFQGCKWGAKWSAAYTDIPRGEATGNLEVRDRAQVLRIEHGADGRVTGVVYADKDGNQQLQAAKVGLRRRELDREPAAPLELGVEPVPGRARQLVGAGRAQLHAAHDRVGLRGLPGAGPDVARHDDGRDRPGRGAARSEPGLRRRLRVRDAGARAAVHGGVPRPGRLGAGVHLGARRLRRTWRASGSSARTCRRRPTG